MASGRPDYFGRTSNVTAVLGTDQEPWGFSKEAEIDPGPITTVYDELVPAGQKISITYFGVSCSKLGINLFNMLLGGVTVLKGYFEIQRDILLGGTTGYIVKAGEQIKIVIVNNYDKSSTFHFTMVGFVQYI
ncbi:hypothetical protein ES707_06700 [subsurface metagenome]